jgi:hypothetical protein
VTGEEWMFSDLSFLTCFEFHCLTTQGQGSYGINYSQVCRLVLHDENSGDL